MDETWGVFVSSRKADQTSRCAVSHIKKWDILLVHGMQSQVEQFSLPPCHYHTFITSIFKSLLWQIDLKVIDERLQLFIRFCCLKKQVKQGKMMPKSGLHMRIIDYLAVHRGPLNCRSSERSKYQQNQEKENWPFSCTACNKAQASSLLRVCTVRRNNNCIIWSHWDKTTTWGTLCQHWGGQARCSLQLNQKQRESQGLDKDSHCLRNVLF